MSQWPKPSQRLPPQQRRAVFMVWQPAYYLSIGVSKVWIINQLEQKQLSLESTITIATTLTADTEKHPLDDLVTSSGMLIQMCAIESYAEKWALGCMIPMPWCQRVTKPRAHHLLGHYCTRSSWIASFLHAKYVYDNFRWSDDNWWANDQNWARGYHLGNGGKGPIMGRT